MIKIDKINNNWFILDYEFGAEIYKKPVDFKQVEVVFYNFSINNYFEVSEINPINDFCNGICNVDSLKLDLVSFLKENKISLSKHLFSYFEGKYIVGPKEIEVLFYNEEITTTIKKLVKMYYSVFN